MDGDLRFDRFTLRPAARELLADGKPLAIGARAFDLLLALAQARGAVVTRDVLFERVWHGAAVGDENLKMQVMALRKLLGAQAIVTAPGRGYRLAPAVSEDPFDGVAAGAARPAAEVLIGRAGELAALDAALVPGALITLAGPGGVGKTRLARTATDAARARFADGLAFVELASLADPAMVAATVARAIDLPSSGAAADAAHVAAALAPLELLLVLDNCEHLIDAAAELARAVHEGAPRVALLATSQQPLALRDERVIRLAGLSDGAADLLIGRVRRADPAYAPDAAEREQVAALAARLDGLPLALELAAARVPLLGIKGVLERLDRQLPLLAAPLRDAPPRQQTLRAALQWSHALLSDTEKTLLRRVAVFAGAFTLDAAVTVAAIGDEWQTLDVLGALVDKSLLVPLGGGEEKRFRLLVTARDFALERLAEAGEETAARDRHGQAVLELFDRAEARYHELPFAAWLAPLTRCVDDLRAALQWAARPGADPQPLFALVGAAGGFWAGSQYDAEARPWFARVAALADDPATPPLREARYWQANALQAIVPLAPVVPAMRAAERAQTLYRQLGDAVGEYRMLSLRVRNFRRVDPGEPVQRLLDRMREIESPLWSAGLRMGRHHAEAVVHARSGDWVGARDRAAAEARVLTEAGDDHRVWGSLYHVAVCEIALGRPEAALAALAPALEAIRAAGLTRTLWGRFAVHLIARIEAGHGRAAAAEMREVVTLLRVAQAPGWIADHMAWWAAQCDAPEDGARLLGWADAWHERQGEARHSHAQAGHDRALAALRSRIEDSRLERLREEGRGLPDEVALQAVLRIAAG
jgi:predicted ATPase/DNA-binding winged helix-turn-helix (wHTH) protein